MNKEKIIEIFNKIIKINMTIIRNGKVIIDFPLLIPVLLLLLFPKLFILLFIVSLFFDVEYRVSEFVLSNHINSFFEFLSSLALKAKKFIKDNASNK